MNWSRAIKIVTVIGAGLLLGFQSIPECVSLVFAGLVVTPYLELEETVSLQNFGTGLGITATPSGNLILCDPSKPGLWIVQIEEGKTTIIKKKSCIKNDFRAASIASDLSGNIWIADPDHQHIIVCSTTGRISAIYDNQSVPLVQPVFAMLFRENTISIWDKKAKNLLLFSRESNDAMVIKLSNILQGQNISKCIMDKSAHIFCLDHDKQVLLKINHNKAAAIKNLNLNKLPYSRISYMAFGPYGYLYLSDAAGNRLFFLDKDLNERGRFLLYAKYFRTIGAFAFLNKKLWLIDEGRKVLFEFAVREARSALEHSLLGEELLSTGYPAAAEQEIKTSLRLDQDRTENLILLGKAFYAQKKYRKALASFQKAERKAADTSKAFFWQGNTWFRLGYYKNALKAYRQALRLKKSDLLVSFNFGQTLLALHKYHEAASIFARLASAKHGDRSATLGLGRALIGMKSWNEAINIFQKIEHDKYIGRIARYYLGLCYMETGNLEKSVYLLKRSSAEGPYYKEAFLSLSEVYKALGDHSKAEKCRLRALKISTYHGLERYILKDEVI